MGTFSPGYGSKSTSKQLYHRHGSIQIRSIYHSTCSLHQIDRVMFTTITIHFNHEVAIILSVATSTDHRRANNPKPSVVFCPSPSHFFQASHPPFPSHHQPPRSTQTDNHVSLTQPQSQSPHQKRPPPSRPNPRRTYQQIRPNHPAIACSHRHPQKHPRIIPPRQRPPPPGLPHQMPLPRPQR